MPLLAVACHRAHLLQVRAQHADAVVEVVRHQHTTIGQVQHPKDIVEHCLVSRAVSEPHHARAHGHDLFQRGHGANRNESRLVSLGHRHARNSSTQGLQHS